jgi:hypothetical protein
MGESGSPCLTPLKHFIDLPGTPLRRTDVDAIFRMFFLPYISILAQNSLAWSIAMIALYSTLSNAFSKSIFRTIICLFDLWQMRRYSKIHIDFDGEWEWFPSASDLQGAW